MAQTRLYVNGLYQHYQKIAPRKMNWACGAAQKYYFLLSGLLKYLPTSRAMRIVK
jgi:hypothetical protein